MTDTAELESVEEFRERAFAWVRANLEAKREGERHRLPMAQARRLQATIFDAGFAGIALPREYGGAGLTFEHQKVWAEAVTGYVIPAGLHVSMGMLGITLLDHGSDALKRRHLPRILRGDEVWIQLLSEPSGGSDMAGAMTRATRDGESWILNGAKIWSTGADEAEYGMCLARTDWDVPKHQGLSMFAVPLQDERVTVEPIVGVDGGRPHFFQEFLDDVVLPAENLIGDENNGWAVAHTLLFHERNATAGVGYGLGLGGGDGSAGPGGRTGGLAAVIERTRASGVAEDSVARALVSEAFVAETVRKQLTDRVMVGMRMGVFKGDWGSLLKLGLGLDMPRHAEIALAAAGTDAVIWDVGDDAAFETANSWLAARSISIAGGTNEMQRNIVSERLLGMPREPASDRDVPFREVVARRQTRD